ncbi:hypothetical protein [Absidia glauca]|uniref:Uncharacterized protein n=1 Tax=Absidia glauca TaxID=4829 RepID=A0A163JQG9_ABSGL|nr:hypothetical protein [Absidia glauca]
MFSVPEFPIHANQDLSLLLFYLIRQYGALEIMGGSGESIGAAGSFDSCAKGYPGGGLAWCYGYWTDGGVTKPSIGGTFAKHRGFWCGLWYPLVVPYHSGSSKRIPTPTRQSQRD